MTHRSTISRSRKASKKNVNEKSNSKEKNLELTLIRTYPHQVAWEVWLPATPTKLTTTVGTGVISSIYPINIGQILNFATRFGGTFVEYRIIRAMFQIRLFNSTNPGVIQFWLDEKNNAAPTVTEATERAILSLSASATDTRPTMKWTNADPLDLQYSPIATVVNVAFFKTYTNNALFGSSAVATDYVEFIPVFQFQFRGLQ